MHMTMFIVYIFQYEKNSEQHLCNYEMFMLMGHV